MNTYIRAIPQFDPARPEGAFDLAGGWAWFSQVEVLSRGQSPRIQAASEVDPEVLARISAPRGVVAGLDLSRPHIMHPRNRRIWRVELAAVRETIWRDIQDPHDLGA